jgi:hypothetical protein
MAVCILSVQFVRKTSAECRFAPYSLVGEGRNRGEGMRRAAKISPNGYAKPSAKIRFHHFFLARRCRNQRHCCGCGLGYWQLFFRVIFGIVDWCRCVATSQPAYSTCYRRVHIIRTAHHPFIRFQPAHPTNHPIHHHTIYLASLRFSPSFPRLCPFLSFVFAAPIYSTGVSVRSSVIRVSLSSVL